MKSLGMNIDWVDSIVEEFESAYQVLDDLLQWDLVDLQSWIWS